MDPLATVSMPISAELAANLSEGITNLDVDVAVVETPLDTHPLLNDTITKETPTTTTRKRGRPRIQTLNESTSQLRERLKRDDSKSDLVELMDRLHADQLQAIRKAKSEILQAIKNQTNTLAVSNEALPLPHQPGGELPFNLPLKTEEEVRNVFESKDLSAQLLSWIQTNVPTAKFCKNFFSSLFTVKLQENSYFRNKTRYSWKYFLYGISMVLITFHKFPLFQRKQRLQFGFGYATPSREHLVHVYGRGSAQGSHKVPAAEGFS